MSALEQYISQSYGITQQEAAAVATAFKPQSLPKGSKMLATGGMCHWLSFLQSGYVRFFAEHGNKEVTQWIGGQGNFVTDLASFVFEAPARWNIETLTDCELYTITREDYPRQGRITKLFGIKIANA